MSRMTYEETEHSTRVNIVPPSPSPSCISSALLNLISLPPPVEALPFLLTLENMGVPLKEYRFTPEELGERVIFPFSPLKSKVNRVHKSADPS